MLGAAGIVWDDEGHIVTNWHVLATTLQSLRPADAQKRDLKVARVTLLDADGLKRDFVATLVGQLRSKDLAVLKISAGPDLLQPAMLGTSSSLRVGQFVASIGNPFGFSHSMSTGTGALQIRYD